MTDLENAAYSERRRLANQHAVERINAAQPVLTGCERASVALGLAEGELGHAGPSFHDTAEIPVPVLRALAGAVLHEGWAGDRATAVQSILRGEIRLRSNHDLGTVSPMTGVVRPSQLVMRIENRAGSGVTYATLAETGRRVLRFGCYDADVAAGLRYLDDVIGPCIARALPDAGLPLLDLIADGVSLGDDVHQRNIGGMVAFIRHLPDLDNTVRSWLFGNPQHFLNYAMAAAKLALDQADGVPHSTIVTAIARNGTRCGVRVAGTGKRWFSAPATHPDGHFFAPHSLADAQPDLGDSAIMEAFGLGGAIAHCAPELARFMQQDWLHAHAAGQRMRALFWSANEAIRPALAEPAGVGVGLDAQRVVQGAQGVRIHTGIAHRDGMTGWIGIGVASAPLACFEQAINGASAS
jgi:hypothetical protein